MHEASKESLSVSGKLANIPTEVENFADSLQFTGVTKLA